jgi:acyl dehydratase
MIQYSFIITRDDLKDKNGDSRHQIILRWNGRFAEVLHVSDIYILPYGRTVAETDAIWLTNVFMILNPVHFNEEYAASTHYSERLVNVFVVIAITVAVKFNVKLVY